MMQIYNTDLNYDLTSTIPLLIPLSLIGSRATYCVDLSHLLFVAFAHRSQSLVEISLRVLISNARVLFCRRKQI